jgi:prepilin peptidase CpaA
MAISGFAAAAAMSMFAGTMVIAGITDLTSYRISNNLMLAFLLAYAAFAPLTGLRVPEIGWSAAVAVAVLGVAFMFFAFGWIGGGDAKLAAVTALWFGVDHTPAYLVYTALFGGMFTLALLKFRELPLPASMGRQPWIARLHCQGAGVPYGVAMAVAGLAMLPQTRWMPAAL